MSNDQLKFIHLGVTMRVWNECQQAGERRLVMLALAAHCDEEGFCRPSQKTLARLAHCSERGVQKMIDALLLEREIDLISAGGGRMNSAVYRLSRYQNKGEPGSPFLEVKGEPHSPLCDAKGEPGSPFDKSERANVEPIKGEPQDTKGERGDGKGEQAVPPNKGIIGIINKEVEEEALRSLEESELLKLWNELGEPFPKIRNVSPSRKATLRTRLREPFFKENWRGAMSTVSQSAFCRGENDRGWIVDIDFFLNQNSFTKIVEGKYTNRTPHAGGKNGRGSATSKAATTPKTDDNGLKNDDDGGWNRKPIPSNVS